MKLYIGVNSDDTAVISSLPLMRFDINDDACKDLAYSYSDTQRPPHWKIDSRGMEISYHGESYLGNYINCDRDSVRNLTGRDMSWNDDVLVIDSPIHDYRDNDTSKDESDNICMCLDMKF